MRIAHTAAGTGLLVAACAVCCAPLIVPYILAGTAGLALSGQVALAVVAAAAGGAVLYRRRRRVRASGASSAIAEGGAACQCAPDAGCNTGESCAVPGPPRTTALARLKSMC